MNIIFICYWGIDEGLTQSTVVPHLKVLSSFPEVRKIILCTIERAHHSGSFSEAKVEHHPLYSKNYKNVLLNKIADFVIFEREIVSLVKEYHINIIFCRSSLAGGLGYRVFKRTGVPFVVESFEPHALYMTESGVWSKYDPRFWIELYFQKMALRWAQVILPVAANYANDLVGQGAAAEKVKVMPCVVDLDKFKRRSANPVLKKKIGVRDGQIVGVYSGKFGGLYYDEEAYAVFAEAKNVFQNFFLIVLTPMATEPVQRNLIKVGLSPQNFCVITVAHSEVPEYLSIADFAFATYKHSPSKKYLSPIKVGEYWAAGLPVLLTEGVGDDASIIELSGCGAIFSLERGNIREAILKIKTQLEDPLVRERNVALAHTYRNPDVVRENYYAVLQKAVKT